MAYNPADGKIYGVADGSLVTVDRFTAEVQAVGQIPVTTNTLACSEDGTFYCNEYGTGKIWQFTLDSLKTEPPVKYDFDGDGTVSTGDVQALLDYATGVRTTVSHREHADFDGNGEITTRDAYLFETRLDAGDLTGGEAGGGNFPVYHPVPSGHGSQSQQRPALLGQLCHHDL